MRYCAVLLLFCLTGFYSHAQNPTFNDYQLLQSKGTIPEDFTMLAQERYHRDVSRATTAANGKLDPKVDAFYLETDYIIDDMLIGGKILFGDTVTQYVNHVADIVLKDEPDLRKQLRFYCLRSTEVNAYSTSPGIIFVSIGLIAQLRTEAELAFVLSHEIAHYTQGHALKEYLQKQDVNENQRSNEEDGGLSRLKMVSAFSQEKESEADSIGMLRFLKSPYVTNSAIGVMEMLGNGERPFHDTRFNYHILETSIMKIPSEYILDTIKARAVEKDNNADDFSTHPNTERRKEALKRIMAGKENVNGKQFMLDSALFFLIRKFCRFECVHYELNKRKYAEAIYNAYGLMHDDTNSIYLERTIALGLYGVAKYKRHDKYTTIARKKGDVSENMQRLNYLFVNLDKNAFNYIAMRYVYDLAKTDQSFGIQAALYDLTWEATDGSDMHIDEIEDYYKDYQHDVKLKSDTARHIKPASSSDEGSHSRSHLESQPQHNSSDNDGDSSGKSNKSSNDAESHESDVHEEHSEDDVLRADVKKFYLLAFADLTNDDKLKNLLDSARNHSQRHSMMIVTNLFTSGEDNRLDIDSMIVSQPFYTTTGPDGNKEYINGENNLIQFVKQMKSLSDLFGPFVQVYHPKLFGPGDVDLYNEMAVFNDWALENFSHDDAVNFVPIEVGRAMQAAAKYHTHEICLTGVTEIKKYHENRKRILILSAIPIVTFPFGLMYYHKVIDNATYYSIVYDLSTGTKQMVEAQTMSDPDKNKLGRFIEETLHRVKRSGDNGNSKGGHDKH